MDARDRKRRVSTADVDAPSGSSSAWSAFNEDNPLRVFFKAILDTNWSALVSRLAPPAAITVAGTNSDARSRPKRAIAAPIDRDSEGLTIAATNEKSAAPLAAVFFAADDFASLPHSIQNLRRIERFMKIADHCRKYVNQLNEEHER